ncbi:MAG: hypothetical protein FD163_2481 [Hyphomonadaceae bacterium]|nr:MAG: hypothetical protein FD128_1869 [Hyphomonadaceae bacterium]KAF0182691.1 MAG: hypothetical protein FD163_2481 [Hyphomonadaceae bacterium]
MNFKRLGTFLFTIITFPNLLFASDVHMRPPSLNYVDRAMPTEIFLGLDMFIIGQTPLSVIANKVGFGRVVLEKSEYSEPTWEQHSLCYFTQYRDKFLDIFFIQRFSGGKLQYSTVEILESDFETYSSLLANTPDTCQMLPTSHSRIKIGNRFVAGLRVFSMDDYYEAINKSDGGLARRLTGCRGIQETDLSYCDFYYFSPELYSQTLETTYVRDDLKSISYTIFNFENRK